MNVLIKHTAKKFLPPIVLQWLSRKGQRGDSWGRPTIGFGGLRLPGGRKFFIRPSVADREVCRQVFLDREYSISGMARAGELMAFYNACSNPLIIDAGANIGAASVWYALTYPRATIVAIEPGRDNFELLKKNTKSFPSVISVNAAIASVSGTLFLCDSGQGAWGYRTASQPSGDSYSVPSMTIEELLALVPNRTPYIFKIDIEGAESELFSRPPAQLGSFPMIAIELHDWMLPKEANSCNFLRWHVDQKRDMVFRGENAFSIATAMPGV